MTEKPISLLLLALIGIAVGSAMASQAGINAELRRGLGSPLLAAFVSFVIGTLCLGTATWYAQAFDIRAVGQVPWWAWFGGVLGAAIVTTSLLLAPRLGALALVASITAGQLLASMALDHFGWLGFSRQPISSERLIGALLVFCGMVLALRH